MKRESPPSKRSVRWGGSIIRISDHEGGGVNHQIPDVNLIYKNGRIDPDDINEYFGTNLAKSTIILL